MHRSARRGALLTVTLAATLPVPLAQAAGDHAAPSATTVRVVAVDPPSARPLRVARAVQQDCVAAPRTGAGTRTTRWIAPADGELRVDLRGRGDWDLAVFEATSLRRVASSAGFGAREVATITVREGATLLLQACRRVGRDGRARLTTRLTRLDLAPLRAAAPGTAALLDVPLRGRDTLARLEATGLDVTHAVDADSARVLVHGDAQRRRLRAAGFTARTVVADLRAADRRAAATLRQATPSALPTGRTTYRTYEDHQRELKEIADRHPRIARAFTLAQRSFQGRELQVLELSRGVGGPDDGRPTFVLNGLHHAREWPAAESIMEFAWDLVQRDGKDPRITKLLDTTRILVMPITNPDGFVVSRAALDPDPDQQTDVGFLYELATGVLVGGGTLAYKRKNCNPGVAVPALPCELAIGVDPNRNYAESWGGPGASTNPNDQSYRGSGPFSEPEPRAVRELVSSTNPTSLLTIHNVAALVLRPPGLEADGFAPDEEALKALGQRMADATGYTNQYGWQLYDTTGTTDDWTYAATGGFGYTIELGPADGVFHGDYTRHVVDQYLGTGPTAGKGVREAYLLAAEAARVPEYTSRVAGRAPAGRTLRLTKAFETETSDVCAVVDVTPVGLADGDPTTCLGTTGVQKVPERLAFTTTVPADGRFEWWVNPSTRPFVAKAGGREEYTLTCLEGDAVRQTQKLFVARGETAQVELPCGGALPSTRVTPASGVLARIGAPARGARASNRRGRALVRITVRRGSLRGAVVRLLPARGSRVLAEGRASTLRGSRVIGLELRRGVRLRPGRHRVRLTARQPQGSPVTVTRTVTLRR